METLIIAELNIKQEKVTSFLEKAETLINETRREKGCLSYKLLNDFEEMNTFIFIEKFRNKEDFEKHKNTNHFKSFFTYVSTILVKEPEINVYQ